MDSAPPIAVATTDPNLEAQARSLAEGIGGTFVTAAETNNGGQGPHLTGAFGQSAFALVLTKERLELRDLNNPRSRPLFVDFVGGPTGYRRVAVGGRRQPIARAIGSRKSGGSGHCPPTVLDATAGLCRDAFLLAALGHSVTAVERSPVLVALVADGLSRAADSATAGVLSVTRRIRLIRADSIAVLRALHEGRGREFGIETPDVVYVDPMYPPSSKSAEVKKDMRILRALVGHDPDATELLSLARGVARSRVVVKRLRHSPPLGPEPSHTVSATRVRYDVYYNSR